MTLLAAIGITCRSEHSMWHPLPPDTATALFRAVVRKRTSDEIAIETDRLLQFGRVPHAVMRDPHINGASWSMFAWLRFATRRWNASFVGHGEDDAFINPWQLDGALRLGQLLVERGHLSVAIGTVETFHWDTNRSSSHFFWSPPLSEYNCMWRNMSGAYKGGNQWHRMSKQGWIIGPYPFMKGELFLWSAHLVDTVLHRTPFLREEGEHHMSRKHNDAPWDDVFAGAVASHAPVSDLLLVNRFLAHHKLQNNASILSRSFNAKCRPQSIGNSCSGAQLSIC